MSNIIFYTDIKKHVITHDTNLKGIMRYERTIYMSYISCKLFQHTCDHKCHM